MQNLVPVSGRNPNSHTPGEIRNALAGISGTRRWSFRYSLLDKSNKLLVEDLDNVIAGKVEQNWLNDIKRTATFTIRDTGGIDFLADHIMPRARLHLAPYGAEDWVEWPLGVFLLSSPKRTADSTGLVTREVQGFDQLQFFADDAPPSRYTVAKNANVIGAVSTLLGTGSKVVTPSSVLMDVAQSWEPGTTRLRIINDLLARVNYNSLSFNETGQAIVSPYVMPDKRAAEWIYADDDYGLLVPGGEQTLDLASVPNRITLVCSDPDRPLKIGVATNTNPANPTSTVRRGRIINMVQQEQDAPNSTYLQTKAQVMLFRASQVYESVQFETGLNPLHSGNDVYRLRYGPLALNSLYNEQSWSMELKAGAKMQHVARRVVQL